MNAFEYKTYNTIICQTGFFLDYLYKLIPNCRNSNNKVNSNKKKTFSGKYFQDCFKKPHIRTG